MRRPSYSQVMAFVLASVLEVHVQADVLNLPSQVEPTQVPENCLTEEVCTISTSSGVKYEWELVGAQVVLSEESVLTKTSVDRLRPIKGDFLVITKSPVQLDTPYGVVSVEENATLLFSVESKQIRLRSLAGRTLLKPRGHEDTISLDAGFENWLGGVDTSGKTTVGILRPLELVFSLSQLARLTPMSKEKFLSFSKELRAKWQDSVYVSANINEKLVARNIATVTRENEERELAKKRWQNEKDQWRKLLWQRTFE